MVLEELIERRFSDLLCTVLELEELEREKKLASHWEGAFHNLSGCGTPSLDKLSKLSATFGHSINISTGPHSLNPQAL